MGGGKPAQVPITRALRRIIEAAATNLEATAPQNSSLNPLEPSDLRKEIIRLQTLNAKLALQNRRYLGLFEMAPVGLLLLSRDGHVQDSNLAAAHLLGQPRAVLGHSHVKTFVRHEDRSVLNLHLLEAQQFQGAALALRILRSDGKLLPVNIFSQPVLDETGQALSLQMVILDISQHKQAENELREAKDHLHHLAHHDSLTGLSNRLLFADRLSQALLMAGRRLRKVGLIYIDVDHFKQINDSFGHSVGDAFLREIAHRLRTSVRDVDTVARLGGDEFSVVLERIETLQQVQDIAEKILHNVSMPMRIADYKFEVTVSLGIALYPDHAGNASHLIQSADAAMFVAKDSGRNQISCFDPSGTGTEKRIL